MDTDPKLLEILVCPVSKTTLSYDRARQELVSKAAGLAYPIRGGIPIMRADEARVLSDAERDSKCPLGRPNYAFRTTSAH
ncbi:MAG: Trm112 family protein [Rhizomicrobium sp.]|nr:Trm112 family protein [Rhizomicrobium sp.]